MKKNLFVLLLLYVNFAVAQVNETFTDGDFTTAPAWSGTTPAFYINANKQLQSVLNSAAQTVTLSTANTLINDVSWQFYLQMDFDPSSQNQARIYLVSNSADLAGSLNGYFIQVGESSNTDSYDLYRQTGTATPVKIIDGPGKPRVNSNQLKAIIKVTRDANGNWELKTATDGSTDFVSEGTATDLTFTSTGYFGVYCKYTATNSGKFIFDDFKIEQISNTIPGPPKLLSVTVKDSITIEAVFDKVLNPVSAENTSNYNMNNGFGHPMSVSASAETGKYLLTLNKALTSGEYLLTVINVEDNEGNLIAAENNSAGFHYTKPYLSKSGDLVINEIFADPSPQVDLPTVEFIELLNTTDHAINLAGWKYSDASTTAAFPAGSIQSGEYLVLSAKADTNEFKRFGKVIGISPWPSLNNGADNIKLTSPENSTIDSIAYSDTWYKSTSKKAGGWTLERIDPLSKCEAAFNWNSSVDPSGGTPGKVNSIYYPNYDNLVLLADSLIRSTDSTLIVYYNKHVNAASISGSNFILTPAAGNFKSISLDEQHIKSTLIFSEKFKPETTYKISLSGISDCSGTNMLNPNTAFTFSVPAVPPSPSKIDTAKIFITELFADPSPEVGLPLSEFIELYNPGIDTVDLNNWILSDPTSKATLKNTKIAPQQYLILCPVADTLLYQPFGKTIGISPWPSLNNTSDQIVLKSFNSRVVDSVSYADTWYKDNLKKQGGWSLELIDLKAACPGMQNWMASIDNKGGTPGSRNSVYKTNTTTEALKIVSASLADSITIRIFFNRSLDPLAAKSINNYMLNNGAGNPDSVQINDDLQTVSLKFSSGLRGATYLLSVSNLTDCSGTIISNQNNSIELFVPEKIEKNDILISEILFNPRPDGVDFVEIYNNSNKIFDLKDLSIATVKDADSLTSIKSIAGHTVLMQPGQYFVLTTDPDNIKKEYDAKYPDAFIKLASLPSFNDDKGSVVLLQDMIRIDQLNYSDKMHFSLLKDVEGISLERSSFSIQTNESGNFRSAAASAGYATPGYKNSQYLVTKESEEEVAFLSKTFSPDNDGFEDVLSLNYNFREVGLMANISVYNDKGLLIRKLLKNSTLQSEGTIIWDGINEDGQKAETGIYVLYLEAFNTGGKVKKYRKNFVLASRLK